MLWSLDLDIAGPKALGMRAVWVSTDVVPADFATPPDATISSLEQLPEVLERWLP
jgi:FMN phosphatase YigB (HAD superfamily)